MPGDWNDRFRLGVLAGSAVELIAALVRGRVAGYLRIDRPGRGHAVEPRGLDACVLGARVVDTILDTGTVHGRRSDAGIVGFRLTATRFAFAGACTCGFLERCRSSCDNGGRFHRDGGGSGRQRMGIPWRGHLAALGVRFPFGLAEPVETGVRRIGGRRCAGQRSDVRFGHGVVRRLLLRQPVRSRPARCAAVAESVFVASRRRHRARPKPAFLRRHRRRIVKQGLEHAQALVARLGRTIGVVARRCRHGCEGRSGGVESHPRRPPSPWPVPFGSARRPWARVRRLPRQPLIAAGPSVPECARPVASAIVCSIVRCN